MNVEELLKVSAPMADDSSRAITTKLSLAANNTLGLSASAAAGQMSDVIGREVSADEAQSTSKIALEFMKDNFAGDAKAGIAFLKDAHDRSPAIGKLDIEELVSSGAAQKMVDISRSNPETYDKMLKDLSSDANLLAQVKANPSAAIDGYIENLKIDVIDNPQADPTTPATPTTTPTIPAPPTPQQKTIDDDNNYLVGLNVNEASNLMSSLAGGFLGDNGNASSLEMQASIKKLLQDAVSIGSAILGNGGEAALKSFAKNLGIDIEAVRINAETGMEITLDTKDSSPDVIESLKEMSVLRPT